MWTKSAVHIAACSMCSAIATKGPCHQFEEIMSSKYTAIFTFFSYCISHIADIHSDVFIGVLTVFPFSFILRPPSKALLPGLLSKHVNIFLAILQHKPGSVGGHYRSQSMNVVFAVKNSAAHVPFGTAFPVLKSWLHQVAQL